MIIQKKYLPSMKLVNFHFFISFMPLKHIERLYLFDKNLKAAHVVPILSVCLMLFVSSGTLQLALL